MSGIGLKVRAEFQKGDDIRDAGLTTPDFVERTDDILYGEDPEWQGPGLDRSHSGAGSVSSEKQNRGKASGDRQYPRRRLGIRR